jgi:hypothetical protein
VGQCTGGAWKARDGGCVREAGKERRPGCQAGRPKGESDKAAPTKAGPRGDETVARLGTAAAVAGNGARASRYIDLLSVKERRPPLPGWNRRVVDYANRAANPTEA